MIHFFIAKQDYVVIWCLKCFANRRVFKYTKEHFFLAFITGS